MSSIAAQRRRVALIDFCKSFAKNRAGMAGFIFLLAVSLIALLAPVITPAHLLDVTQLNNQRFAPPSLEHLFGTDHLSRDLLVRMVWGARSSLIVGLSATAMSMVIGTLVGIAAGYFQGWIASLWMRIIDFFLVLPSLILAIVLSSVMSRGMLTIIIAIGVTSWAGTARVVRSQALTISTRDYVERAKALGAGHWHIILKHIFPGVLPLVLANTTLTVGSAIIAESTLAFLGLGDTTKQSWGTILRNSMDVSAATSGYWWYVLIPGLAIVSVVLAFTLIGRAVETIVNPTLRSR
ncbi:ABC transporter permease [Canibacter zhoujuaniae]|uniref:ABC transporter permease n=1 Tax=Canibacter zhoujuaniae TaxID=2708343 RepID=UPI00141EC295|nr:ABC transporter permease [Canibacter zhoujuaniae]